MNGARETQGTGACAHNTRHGLGRKENARNIIRGAHDEHAAKLAELRWTFVTLS
jgi:hypothetical protein